MHTRKHNRHSRRGLSRVELIVIIVAVAGVLCVAVCLGAVGIMLPALAKARSSARQIKCGTQVRNVIQAMTIFAQGNKDSYPIPSMLDANNLTTPVAGRAKDTSNNVLSVLVFSSMISPELLVCPSETNANIRAHTGYQNVNPSAAVNPGKALWDPSFNCDFTAGVAHNSYAMQMANGDPQADPSDPAHGRLSLWSNTFNATEAVFGNRGPQITGRDASGKATYDTRSNTMGIHGGRTTWEGNIGYNDNHVNFETTVQPSSLLYRTAKGKQIDCLFLDESDDVSGKNIVLGVWVKAGKLASDYKGIHD